MVGSALLIPDREFASTHSPADTLAPERVTIRLHGRYGDVRSVAARLRIDLDWDGAERRPGDACSADGRLDLAESPRPFL